MNIYNETTDIKIEKASAVALGAFDGLHLGHMKVIGEAVRSRFEPSVFTFEEDPSKFTKGRAEYLITKEDKLKALEKSGVRNLFSFDFQKIRELPPERFFTEILIGKCRAAMLTCGENFRFGKGAAGDTQLLEKLCRENGVTLKICDPVNLQGEIISSTGIRAALKNGDVKAANRMLGHHFYFTQPVIGGNRIGRTLGTPTINQLLPEGFVKPKFGVYAALVDIDGDKHWGVANIGTKPTVGKYDPLSETWIGEFKGDLYGRKIRIELLDFIREEKKFDSLDALKAEIMRNAEIARALAEPYLSLYK